MKEWKLNAVSDLTFDREFKSWEEIELAVKNMKN